MQPTIVYLHGLNASHLSFAHFVDKYGEHEHKLINYKSHQPLADSIAQVTKILPKGPLVLVGHSLGGVIAMNIAHNESHDIQNVVTISSPLGGSKAALYLRYFAHTLKVIADITPVSPLIRKLEQPPNCQVLSLISTAGHLPITSEPNDSVVTVKSQSALPYAKKLLIPANHFEVLNHTKTIDSVKRYLNG